VKSVLNVTLVLLLLVFAAPSVFSQETSNFTKEVSGEITAVDAANSTFSVLKVIDQDKGLADNINIKVEQKTVIKKNKATLTFSDLQMGDTVSVIYTSTLDDKNIAQSVLVK
jgi:hypothetical protein